MSRNDPGGLAAALARLEALAERPDDEACALVVREIMRALPYLKLDPMESFRDGVRRVRSRLARERRPDGLRMDGLMAALEILCEEHDAAIAHLRCDRCGRHRASSHTIVRTLRGKEERVCTECKDRRLDQGWSLLTTDPLYAWCFSCQSHKKPMHCVGPTPDPMVLRVCDLCTEELRSAGWRPAVSVVHCV